MINLTVKSSPAYTFGSLVAKTPVFPLCQELHRGTVPRVEYTRTSQIGRLANDSTGSDLSSTKV